MTTGHNPWNPWNSGGWHNGQWYRYKTQAEMGATMGKRYQYQSSADYHNQDDQLLRAIAASWFKHPSPITQHEREMQYQAYKARLILELGLAVTRAGNEIGKDLP